MNFMQRAMCAITTLLLATPLAHAQDPMLPEVQLQRFRPATGPGDFLNVYGTPIPEHLEWDIGFYLDYARVPLQINTGGTGGANFAAETVDTQATLSLMGNIGLAERFEVGFLLPLTVFQSSDELQPILENRPRFSTDELMPVAVNDSRLTGKWRILDIREDALGLAMVGGVSFPLSTRDTLTSDGGFGFETHIAADKFVFGGIRVGGNLGFRFRGGSRLIRNNTIGMELPFGAAASIPMFFDRLDAVVELDGAIGIEPDGLGASPGLQEGEVNAELKGAVRFKINEMWTLTGGLGFGMSEGVGTPDFRGILGVHGRWVTGGSWGYDFDGDGIYGKRDVCPNESEDFDGHKDFDGCPDFDNDGDGIPDKEDKCNNTPDGVEVKDDGCPDNDIDGDGIPNKYDKCPEEKEDRDRFEDADGCPENDNDKDGFLDKKDNCPNEPETKNGFLDDDGCPDDPEDKVVVTKNKLIITEPVYFATNRDRILDRSRPILNEVARVLSENPQLKFVRIEGHTDDKGRDSYNLKLSQRRANSVRKYLIGKGIDRDRLEAVGYGETQPIAENDSAEGRAKNRRVEFTILDQD